MPITRPISELRRRAGRISTLAHNSGEPIFITKNGEGEMVVMSLASYGRLRRRLEMYSKLASAQAEVATGRKPRPLSKVLRGIRRGLRGG